MGARSNIVTQTRIVFDVEFTPATLYQDSDVGFPSRLLDDLFKLLRLLNYPEKCNKNDTSKKRYHQLSSSINSITRT